MSLSLLSFYSAVSPNGLTVPFSGVSGTAPYVFSVDAGGAGGTIDASTGLYTSPTATGVDTVRVTDSLSATATLKINICTALELVCDIIKTSMSLGSDQVFLWDQKWTLPIDSLLYVAVSQLTCKPFGNTRSFYNGIESQSVNVSATIGIDIMSRGPAARDQKELVLLALNSGYAESQMEMNSFRVFPICNNFTNLSEVDGAAIPYRYHIDVQMQYFVTNTVSENYYGTFSVAAPVTNP